MAFTYNTKLANIVVPYNGRQYGMIVGTGTGIPTSDSGALYIKALISEVSSNPNKLDIVFNKSISPSKLSFFVNKTDNTYELKEFRYSNGHWMYNGNQVNLEDYGITVLGSPSNGDKFVAKYSLRNISSVKGTLKDSKILKTITKKLVPGPKRITRFKVLFIAILVSSSVCTL